MICLSKLKRKMKETNNLVISLYLTSQLISAYHLQLLSCECLLDIDILSLFGQLSRYIYRSFYTNCLTLQVIALHYKALQVVEVALNPIKPLKVRTHKRYCKIFAPDFVVLNFAINQCLQPAIIELQVLLFGQCYTNNKQTYVYRSFYINCLTGILYKNH